MKNKTFIFVFIGILIAAFGVTLVVLNIIKQVHASSPQTESIAVDPISSTITAEGAIHSQNEATLSFQTGGKLTYLPFKVGDSVKQGQTIAQLDTYALQRNLQLAANAYQTAKNSTDQTQENNQAGVVEGQQRTALDASTSNTYNNITEAQIVTDTVKRFVNNSNLAQNSAQLNVDLANYAIQLATLTAPFNGVVTHEDVTVANQNVTPSTTFSIADPSNLVFKANILPTDIDFVSVGSPATIRLDGQNKTYQGTVTKIYPDKTTLSNGQKVYVVEIQSDAVKTVRVQSIEPLLGKSGSVTIQSNTNANVIMVPTWTVLNYTYLWVMEDNKPVLKQITVGKTHGTNIEITSGLKPGDKVIINPKGIAQKEYQLL
ncbi:MAG TPA: efflux RND transporter periplasmic adaptor subunit [Candidatus Saccharimonadales bacterium]|nr:efflux RND transporter periplasmic adaptor subunit [Candidatus Saccharimonadales bacterium]